MSLLFVNFIDFKAIWHLTYQCKINITNSYFLLFTEKKYVISYHFLKPELIKCTF